MKTISLNTNIYIVDDEPDQVDMLVEMLSLVGLNATGYTSPALFIEQSITENDIVLLDLNMPLMDGIEVMRVLHDNACKPDYLLMSGFDERVLHSAKQFADAKKITVKGTFSKPLDIRPFISFIESLYQDKVSSLSTLNKPYNAPENTLNISLSELKQSLKEHRFTLFYQPKIHLQSGCLQGFEALVRLNHPEKGLVFPDQFIELAEQSSLISEITNEVITQVISDYPQFIQAGITPKISINISAQDLMDLNMPERLESMLKKANIAPDLITVELTESSILSSVSDSLDILSRMRMKGFPISIDDFGTGHSSLVQLYRIPFTELKIDQHFVMQMMTDDEAISIVKICILLAKELKMSTVAEGIEDQSTFDKLKELGCEIGQGYFMSKPLPINDIFDWVSKNKQTLL